MVRHSINSQLKAMCCSNTASLLRQERGKVGVGDFCLSCLLGVPLPPPVSFHKIGLSGALLLPECLPLLPSPTVWPGFGAEWAHLTHEATSAPCEGWWRLSRGGNGGATAAPGQAQAGFGWGFHFIELVCKMICFPKSILEVAAICTCRQCGERNISHGREKRFFWEASELARDSTWTEEILKGEAVTEEKKGALES